MKSLQDTYAPTNICFGCGPANPNGLQIKSFVEGDKLTAAFVPRPEHQAFLGILNGGIIGALLDCHCNWMAAYHLMNFQKATSPPCTVTAEYTIRMIKPTPANETLELKAWVIESSDRRVKVAGSLAASQGITANCEGIFVAVKPGHPAYHRW